MADTQTTPDSPIIRGTHLFKGEDAARYAAICKRLIDINGKQTSTAEILRDALKCYAVHLNVTV